jgi:predicted metalloprotease with PDZ domain
MSYITAKQRLGKKRQGRDASLPVKKVVKVAANSPQLKKTISSLQKLLRKSGARMLELEKRAHSLELGELLDVTAFYKEKLAKLAVEISNRDTEISYLQDIVKTLVPEEPSSKH